ncbi:hypothetical protein TDSAC_1420 [Thermodesulfobium acidiphilum]|uniref:Uncharacterized protein n=1 Tax=Thermodesulfobium acidiphilum TaxID=1794699 RepID=A0A2R4W216_THEAF|nr:hypothetical protein [Thermodesulfobium acidiphilum]AWB10760.1 hypothetical protein TDSAC_1420 [Thermodesulfobium acidiphilum]
MEKTYNVLIVFVLSILLNVPFGRLRSKVNKFSKKWFLYVHLPIPFIALPRIFLGISVYFIPLLVIGSVIGQVIGARFNFKIR